MDQPLLFPDHEVGAFKIKFVIKRNGRKVKFRRSNIADGIFKSALEIGGKDRLLAEKMTDNVVIELNKSIQGDAVSTEEIGDIVERVLADNRHFRTAKAYIIYRAENRRKKEAANERIVAEDNIPYKLVWQIFSWNMDHGCETIENLNKHIIDNTFPRLVTDAEEYYHDEIRKVAEAIVKRREDIKLVIVAGPSSSGKTTTTIKISEKLKEANLEFVLLALDNYFKDLNEHPKDEYGDYDFETPQALDLPLINDHLYDLLNGKKIKMPLYDFKTGKRKLNQVPFQLKENQILLIDSLHGLYDDMTKSIQRKVKFKFYIEALCQMKTPTGEFVRWTDLRMLRRMIRDSWHRSYNPLRTVGHWHYVRRSEKKFIVPFINTADYVFNGALPYELPVHKKFLFKYFPEILAAYEGDPKKTDAYIRAKRVYEVLSALEEVRDLECIPQNSLMREFIGGSSYKY